MVPVITPTALKFPAAVLIKVREVIQYLFYNSYMEGGVFRGVSSLFLTPAKTISSKLLNLD